MIISNNIADFVKKMEALPVTKLYKLDTILSDLGNHICEVDKTVEELKDRFEYLDKEQKANTLNGLHTLKNQLIELSDTLYKMDYDSHYMDRTLSVLDGILETIEKLK